MTTMAMHLPVGSVTLTRVCNGWRVCRVVSDVENEVTYEEYVFQDDESVHMPNDGTADASTLVSLCAAVREMIGDDLQSKHRGGLSVDIRPARTYEERD